MSEPRENIDTAFARLADIAGFEGLVFVSPQGAVLASKFIGDSAAPDAAERIAASLKDINSLIQALGSHGLEELFIRGRQRCLFLLKSARVGFLTVAVGRNTMNTGLARLKLKETVDELEKTLDAVLSQRRQA
jgi:predicted regulator of Ras-like GTPase activity (Roadblock/LC7/MglB family)